MVDNTKPKDGIEANKQKAEALKKKDAPNSVRFSDQDIRTIRALRSENNKETGKPTWSHGKLAAKFGTGAGTISQIVRNRTYADKDYKPSNDGV